MEKYILTYLLLPGHRIHRLIVCDCVDVRTGIEELTVCRMEQQHQKQQRNSNSGHRIHSVIERCVAVVLCASEASLVSAPVAGISVLS